MLKCAGKSECLIGPYRKLSSLSYWLSKGEGGLIRQRSCASVMIVVTVATTETYS